MQSISICGVSDYDDTIGRAGSASGTNRKSGRIMVAVAMVMVVGLVLVGLAHSEYGGKTSIASKNDVVDDIAYGKNVSGIEKYPYVVRLVITTKDGKEGICSGIIVDLGWALTALHCTENAASINVMAGSMDLNCQGALCEGKQEQPATAVRKFKEKYSAKGVPKGVIPDVALIKLQKKFKESKYVKPIKINGHPGKCFIKAGRVYRFVGWGRIQNKEKIADLKDLGQPSDRLKMAQMKAESGGVEAKLVYTDKVDSPGYTCPGDSGGPLIPDTDDIDDQILLGVISQGNAIEHNGQDYCVQKKEKDIAAYAYSIWTFFDWLESELEVPSL